MIRQLKSLDAYMSFIHEINSDPDFCDPMLSNEEQIKINLLNAINKPDNQVIGVFDDETIIGLFVFLILPDERYIEMLVGLSKDKRAYDEMLDYLRGNYAGFQADFVYNPKNDYLQQKMEETIAEFEVEQQKMVLKNSVTYQSDKQIILYKQEYREQYVSMHGTDVYWTAERVIDALDRFRIILAIENDMVVGYLDITHKYKEKEPYDIFVKEEYRGRGYGKAMLAKAIELNKPNTMMLLVDVDNFPAIAMYEKLGFVKVPNENNMTAHVLL